MTSVQFVKERKAHWSQLEMALKSPLDTYDDWLSLSKLYRGLCTDISMAHHYQLPEQSISYLNQLAALTHSKLYGGQFLRRFNLKKWFFQVPHMLTKNIYIKLGFALFWVPFLLAMILAFTDEKFALDLLGPEQIAAMQEMYADPPRRSSIGEGAGMSSFYIFHNVNIGLQCFGLGILFGLGSLFALLSNGLILGGVFGVMLASPQSAHFAEFVMAHGPFELTGICLAGAAGMQLGYSMVDTKGLSRVAALRLEAHNLLPLISFASLLIFLAAFIEGFVSASALPIFVKASVMIATALLLVIYMSMPMWKGRL